MVWFFVLSVVWWNQAYKERETGWGVWWAAIQFLQRSSLEIATHPWLLLLNVNQPNKWLMKGLFHSEVIQQDVKENQAAVIRDLSYTI